jgi:hypothetical protein
MDYPGKVITKNQVTPTQTSATGVWTLDDAAAATRNNNWPVAGVPNPISKSLRFNSADSAYLNRTPASASNRKTWTWSGWVKKTGTSISTFISADPNSGNRATSFYTRSITDGRLEFEYFDGTTTYNLTCAALLRDPSAYYHLILAVDTTQATNTNRTKIYVNGVQQTLSGTYVPQNTDMDINNTVRHNLGRFQNANVGAGSYLDGYLTEVNFIDGQALTPSSFGMTDPVTGVWEPLKYSGTYGTNGFYLNFKDATSTTTLGLDYSGNSNTWTTNNFSVTAGSGNDSLTDVPTPWIVYNTTGDVGGVVRGNYATLNPISTLSASATLSNGNLDVTTVSTGDQSIPSTIGMVSGKYYSEFVWNSSGNSAIFGLIPINMAVSRAPGYEANSVGYRSDGFLWNAGSSTSSWGATWTTGDVIGLAFDASTGSLDFYKNNVKQGSTITGLTTSPYFFAIGEDRSAQSIVATANFGQRPFAYTPPSGFLSLCTTNLPASTVLKGSEYFDAKTWSGNSSTQSVSLEFAPGLIWNKNRSGGASNHAWWDVLRGTGAVISSSTTEAETTGYNAITSFSSNAISLGPDNTGSNNGRTNETGRTYVGWVWNAGSSTVTNTAGSITSTVSANTTSGFSIVTYTGTGANATVGHGLGVAPSMIIIKRTNSTNSWQVYHSNANASPASGGLFLNTTDAFTALSTTWNNTVPASTVFSIGTAAGTNASGGTYVAYCFAAISGFSAFGSYTGNGSADGPFVYLGFRPRYVLIKRTDSASAVGWFAWDTARGSSSGGNVVGYQLYPNLSNAESSSSTNLDILSNGFKLRDTYQDFNASGGTFIYACFAENPFKNALAR